MSRHYSPPDLRVAPAAPDEEPLVEYIDCMPGGRYIQPHWRSEPHHVVSVTVEEVRWLLSAICAAFPPYASKDRRRLVFNVPEIIGALLVWNAEEYVWSAEDQGEFDDAALIAEVASRVWDEDAEMEDLVEGALQVIDQAEAIGSNPRALAQAIATFLSDGMTFDDARDAAIVVFREPAPTT